MRTTIEECVRESAMRHEVEIVFGFSRWQQPADVLNVVVQTFDDGLAVNASLWRSAMRDEGEEARNVSFRTHAGTLGPEAMKQVDAFVAEAARLLRREAAMARHVHSGLAPSWSYVMHRLPRLILSHSAKGLDLVFCPVEGNLVKPYRSRAKRKELATGRALSICQTDFVGRYGRNVVEARADRIFVHDLEIEPRLDNSPLAVFRDLATPELMVTGLRLPETVAASCGGMDLAEIIGHPALGAHAGIPVIRAVNDDSTGSVRLILPRMLEPAGPTPHGVDVGWRTV